mmetsp:Transcript_27060/g.46320  ORF Transcript_27060/g.46320 Transcript_27060/m.46320 type:complete len:217 (+) Transcript_27060:4339-4989(+)
MALTARDPLAAQRDGERDQRRPRRELPWRRVGLLQRRRGQKQRRRLRRTHGGPQQLQRRRGPPAAPSVPQEEHAGHAPQEPLACRRALQRDALAGAAGDKQPAPRSHHCQPWPSPEQHRVHPANSARRGQGHVPLRVVAPAVPCARRFRDDHPQVTGADARTRRHLLADAVLQPRPAVRSSVAGRPPRQRQGRSGRGRGGRAACAERGVPRRARAA